MSLGNLNKVILMGRLTKDPILKTTENGLDITSFTLAVNKQLKNKENNNIKSEVSFIDCVAFNKQAISINKFFTKGNLILISGSLKQENWTNKEGQKKSNIKIYIETFNFIEPKKENLNNTSENTNEDEDQDLFKFDELF